MIDFTAIVNGLTIGAGTSYRWASFPAGVFGIASIDPASALQRSRAHGVYGQPEWLRDRSLVFDIHVLGTSALQAEQLGLALLGAFRPNTTSAETVLQLQHAGGEYRLLGRPRGGQLAARTSFRQGVLKAQVEFVATDPRLYSNTLKAPSTGLSTVSGGLTFNASPPFTFGSAGGGGLLDCSNAGTFETPWVATFTGPIVSPSLEHVGQAKIMSFSGTLAAGETLVVDSAARTVLLNGTASRYSWLSSLSQWFTLEPGVNTLRFAAASGTGTVSVAYRDAWM